MLSVILDGTLFEAAERMTILAFAALQGTQIPSLCHHAKLKPYSACRICLVEASIAGSNEQATLVPACSTSIEDGMTIDTRSKRVIRSRRFIGALLLARNPEDPRMREINHLCGLDNDGPEYRDPAVDYLISRRHERESTGATKSSCVVCGKCVRVCEEVIKRSALCFSGRNIHRHVTTPFNKDTEACIGCKACEYLCPTHAITIESGT